MSGVCLVGRDGPGGIRTYTRTVSSGLSARWPDRSVRVIDSRGKTALLSPLRAVRAIFDIAVQVAAGRCDAVHLMASERLSLVRKTLLAVASRLMGTRVVMHHHGAEFPTRAARAGPLGRLALRCAMRAPHLHLVLGEDWAAALRGAGVPAGRIVKLPNALEDSPPLTRPAHGGPLRALFLGEVSRRKGIETALHAAAIAAEGGVRVDLRICGDGPDMEAARGLACDLGLDRGASSASAHFAGRVDAGGAQEALAWADVLLHPSTHEGLPMVLLEAMRAGLPCIATPVGAIAESLPDGEGVLHVAPGDPAALASVIRSLSQSPGARAALGLAGRRLFEARFRLSDHLDRLVAAYGWQDAPQPSTQRAEAFDAERLA